MRENHRRLQFERRRNETSRVTPLNRQLPRMLIFRFPLLADKWATRLVVAFWAITFAFGCAHAQSEFEIIGAAGDCLPNKCVEYGRSKDRACEACLGLQEIWIVDATGCPEICELESGFRALRFIRCRGDSKCAVSYESFIANMNGPLSTSVYVHGYSPGKMVDEADALELAQAASHAAPFRLVIWQWKIEHRLLQGLKSNVVENMDRAERQGYYIAKIASRIRNQTALALVGHSFGSISVCAALHSLAVEQSGHESSNNLSTDSNRPIQTVLIAPAIGSESLLPSGRFSLATTQVDRMLITYNPRDRSLNAQAKITGNGNILGLTGMRGQKLLTINGNSITQMDVSSHLGGIHWLYRMLQESSTRRCIGAFVVANP